MTHLFRELHINLHPSRRGDFSFKKGPQINATPYQIKENSENYIG